MKLSVLSAAVLLTALPLTTFAAGLDRSGQSIAAFLQPGNYAEAGLSVLDPTVEGQGRDQKPVSDMADDYYFPSAAVKVQATDKISLGLLYDQPYGADASYAADNVMFGNGVDGTTVEVRTNNLTALLGYQPNQHWNFYAGPVWQTVEADIRLRGAAYGGANKLGNYNIKVDQEPAFGWLAGFAYQIPEIALKAALTYRSEIKHKANATETSSIPQVPAGYHPLFPNGVDLSQVVSTVEAVTPQSVNLDFQTGIAADTLAFANVRWVHWDNFVVSPTLLNHPLVNQNLIDYSDDQWSANVGVGRKFNAQWAANVALGYDTGAGNPVTTLGPTEGYWSIGLGGQYSPAEHYFIQGGVKYFWLGDATAQTGGNAVGQFSDNHAIGYGMKIGYRF